MSNNLGNWMATVTYHCPSKEEVKKLPKMVETAKAELLAMFREVMEVEKKYQMTFTYSKRAAREMMEVGDHVYYDFWLRIVEIPTKHYPLLGI